MADSKNNKKIEQSDLAAIISDEVASSRSYYESEVGAKYSRAIEYREGRMRDVRTLPNRSTQTSSDVSDHISWTLPGVIDVYTASNEMVRYEATSDAPDADQWARDATDFMNHDFLRNNPGYPILYDVTFDGLQLGDGVVACYWKPQETKRETLRRQNLDDLSMIMEDAEAGKLTVVSQNRLDDTEEIEVFDPIIGDMTTIQSPLFDVKVVRIVKKGHIVDKACKPENLRLNDTGVRIDDSRFVGYVHDDITRSDLMEMADEYDFDVETIKKLPSEAAPKDEAEQSRQYDRVVDNDSPVRSMDRIELWECYVKADVDGDGIAELIRAWYAGDQVLAWDEWEDDIPYTKVPCYPVPHRADAESISDRVMDIQKAKTVVKRGLMDNIYSVALPQREVEEGSVLNPDALVHPRFGGMLWKKKGSAPIVDHETPFIGDKLLLALNYLDEDASKRTGVNRTSMALDPETLQNQTATASNNNRDASYSQQVLIARNMARYGGWETHFAKRLRLAKKYQQITSIPDKTPAQADVTQQQIAGPEGMAQAPTPAAKFRQVNPSQWASDMLVRVNVGLGTGSRDRDLAMLGSVLQTQLMLADRFMAAGATEDAIDMLPKIINTLTRMAESAGLQNPEDYYPPYTEDKVAKLKQLAAEKAQHPDPEVVKEQARAEAQSAMKDKELAAQGQLAQMQAGLDAQNKQVEAEANVAKEAAQLQADLQTKEADRQAKLQEQAQQAVLEREKYQAELQFRYAELAQQRELAYAEIASREQLEREKMTVSAMTAQATNETRAAMAANKPNGRSDA